MSDASAAPGANRVLPGGDLLSNVGFARIVVLALVGAGLILRLHGYAQTPPPGGQADEYAWAWSGLTLITQGRPTAWSYIGIFNPSLHYPSPVWFSWAGSKYPLITPWVDHPPVFSLLIGGFGWLLGARDLSDVRLDVIRVPVILLSTASIWLVYELGRRTIGRNAAVIAAALLALTPAAVLFGRTVEAENLLIPIFLGSLILADIHLQTGRRLALWGCLALCLLAPLVKTAGLSVGVTIASLYIVSGRVRPGLAVAMAAAAGLAIYAAYGAALGWDSFLAAMQGQSARRAGLLGAYDLLMGSGGATDVQLVHDGWWLVGLIGTGWLLFRGRDGSRRTALVLLPVVIYMAFFALAGNDSVGRYGWYRWAIFPLVYLAAGALIQQTVRRPSLINLLLVGSLAGAATFNPLVSRQTSVWLEAALLVLFAIPGLLRLTRFRGSAVPVAATLMGILILVNVYTSLLLSQIYPRL